MRAFYIFLFWLVAATLVWASHGMLALQLGAIVLAGLAYTRLTVRSASIQHTLGVGVAWAMLCIVAELALHVPLLGGPTAHPVYRDLLLLSWIAAPALFTRQRGEVTTRA